MKKLACLVAVLVIVPATVNAADAINPFKMAVGQASPLPGNHPPVSLGGDPRYDRFEVYQVLGEREMAVECIDGDGHRSDPFVVKGVSTSGYADGSRVKFPGYYRVTGTKTFKRGRTLFVVEPEK